MKKKIKIIVFTLLIIFVVLILFFVWKNKKVTQTEEPLSVSPPVVNNSTGIIKQETVASSSPVVATEDINSIIEKTLNPETEKVDQAKRLNELEILHPSYSSAQLEFYTTTAANNEVLPCRNRQDENACIAAVAFINRADNVCGEIRDESNSFACSDIILNETASGKITRCEALNSDFLKAQCLLSAFNAYKQVENCSGLKDTKVKKTCEDVAYYQSALKNQNHGLCASIGNENIKKYCSTNIVDKTKPLATSSPAVVNELLDSDKDGLSDVEEAAKYLTDPKNPDTDGDSFLDGAEVKGGYNPCGEGKLPDLEALPSLCAKFKK